MRRRNFTWLATALLLIGLVLPAGSSAKVSAIAFERIGIDKEGIWALPAAGGEPSLLAFDANNPSFSPDGTRIAFSNGSMNVDRTDPVYYPEELGLGLYGRIDYGPSNRVAVAPRGESIRLIKADGSGFTDIYSASGGDEFSSPSFSPSGTQLVFNRFHQPDPDPSEGLWLVNSNGTGADQLTTQAYDDNATFSPSGARIAFARATAYDPKFPPHLIHDIFLIDPDGGDLVNVTNTPAIDENNPTFSPDGSRLANSADAPFDEHIEIINVDGTGREELTSSLPGLETKPTWENIVALPPPGPGPDDEAACRMAEKELKAAKKRVARLIANDASTAAIKKAKKQVKKAKKNVKAKC